MILRPRQHSIGYSADIVYDIISPSNMLLQSYLDGLQTVKTQCFNQTS